MSNYTSSANRVAIVTGASRGIGRAIAERLAEEGFAVVVNYSGNQTAADETVTAIQAAGGTAKAIQANIADPAAVATLFDATEAAFGGVDVAINNAGIMKLAPVVDCTDAVFDETISINLKGSFNVAREAGKRLRAGGRIINLSTSVIGMRLPSYGVYIATKAAVEGLTQVMAQEMRGRNITVNAVAPGPTATDLFLNGKSPELIDRMSKMNPLERLGKPDDIANVVAFLCGSEGAWVNGQILRVNGGMC